LAFQGFLDASAADLEAGVQLHYWFAEASVPDARQAPIVLWLNGGKL
jgi:carboxypeptidase C (cathepsin A)